ncbi:polyprenyl synthetase family protein [Corynebacterium sp. ES2794-CONJ1]|uniref:polyprenyl synthetase family protein n=1 Tax=unclassified Corynebacterium TaxID=2624378 RepID=UPI002169156A|nr:MULTISPECIES: polyprenyl synthetase family protein [unclassified Corynebacterium]MCS4489694.1 polyprenyl synthetase family protein [Corynebacterium sp. ES2775-CONJ]MCS4491297.1 polyprenyl synthetase family protein [Corynebacterium sp. ES2715-CONJ3]MCS4531606.1 polyprenyl synthetase family protein [Corynebacterium sp. ES2730-CONJ]MCU9519002.1 polyprenyl synthetase family protein [Corynebacterium sp. ES2794-CONJ1]
MSNRAELRQHTGDSAIGTRLDLGDNALNEQIAEGMVRVEATLRAELNKGEDFVTDKVMHLTKAGGKRFRPMFSLLASNYGPNPMNDDVVKAAIVIEMTHLATLYHDDVMDEATQRRGVESANARWTNSIAILAGDILLAHASRLMAELGADTVAHFAKTFGGLVTGQMRETLGAGKSNAVDHYMKVIDEKTGVLIAAAGYLGALHSGADERTLKAVEAIGSAIGMIFQIVDDIIDIFSDSSQSGKTPGTDLREGVFTLPVLYALEEDSVIGEELRLLLTGPLRSDEEIARALTLLGKSKGRDKALADVHRFMAVAEKNLDLLPQNSTTEALRTLARLTVARVG